MASPLLQPSRVRYLLAAFTVGVVLVLPALGEGGSQDPAVEIGHEYYLRYCASCHGVDADGRGDLAADLRTAPTNLRQLIDRYGRPLAVEQITRFIDGRETVTAHGRRGMPVWGRRFAPLEEKGEPPRIHPEIRAIMAYLATIQYDEGVVPKGSKP